MSDRHDAAFVRRILQKYIGDPLRPDEIELVAADLLQDGDIRLMAWECLKNDTDLFGLHEAIEEKLRRDGKPLRSTANVNWLSAGRFKNETRGGTASAPRRPLQKPETHVSGEPLTP